MQHSEFYTFAIHFWWLIFPIGWGLVGIMRIWLRHRRAQQALQLLTAYAQQNKEPPTEILALLQTDTRHGNRHSNPVNNYRAGGLFFSAIAAAFLVLIFGHIDGGDHNSQVGLIFVTVLMSGFAAAMFVLGWFAKRGNDVTPPS